MVCVERRGGKCESCVPLAREMEDKWEQIGRLNRQKRGSRAKLIGVLDEDAEASITSGMRDNALVEV